MLLEAHCQRCGPSRMDTVEIVILVLLALGLGAIFLLDGGVSGG